MTDRNATVFRKELRGSGPFLSVGCFALIVGCVFLGGCASVSKTEPAEEQVEESAPEAEPVPRVRFVVDYVEVGEDGERVGGEASEEVSGVESLLAETMETEVEEVAPAETEVSAGSETSEKPEVPKVRRTFWDYIFFWRKPKTPIPAASMPANAGSIYLINLPANFVVIESPSAVALKEGTILGAVRDGEVESLFQVSRERRPPFHVAEIVSGTPHRGDRVVILETLGN